MFPVKMVIFHGYVKEPEGILKSIPIIPGRTGLHQLSHLVTKASDCHSAIASGPAWLKCPFFWGTIWKILRHTFFWGQEEVTKKTCLHLFWKIESDKSWGVCRSGRLTWWLHQGIEGSFARPWTLHKASRPNFQDT